MKNKSFNLGLSSCPNDTFVFDAIINRKIDLKNISFKPFIADVEVLNNRILQGKLDVSKVSFATYKKVKDTYHLLNSGSALGKNCGPLLVVLPKNSKKNISEMTIAIPGENTTANMLLTHFFPNIKQKKSILFSNIEEAVVEGKTDAGLIIHENRFTYKNKGLVKLFDLGELWEKHYQLPIPLGGIIVKKSLGKEIINHLEEIMYNSVYFAMNNPDESKTFIKKYAQSIDDKVCQQHISLYVNNYTLDMGDIGKKAVEKICCSI